MNTETLVVEEMDTDAFSRWTSEGEPLVWVKDQPAFKDPMQGLNRIERRRQYHDYSRTQRKMGQPHG